MTDPFTMPPDIIELRALRSTREVPIPPGQIRVSVESEEWAGFMRREFLRFERDVQASLVDEKPVTSVHTAGVTHTWRVPASWWDHWKLDHADAWWASWLVRRRPWRMKEVSLTREVTFRATMQAERWAAFPDSTWVPEALGRPTYIMRYTPVRWREVR